MSDATPPGDEALRTLARERIAAGALPRDKATHTWGGLGSGLPCSLCGELISRTETEMELQLGDGADAPVVRFHLRCHLIWETARREAARNSWIRVVDELPPQGAAVEARIAIGEGRSVILTVSCEHPGAIWLNVNTGEPLPAGWRPIEWRYLEVPRTETESRAELPTPRRA